MVGAYLIAFCWASSGSPMVSSASPSSAVPVTVCSTQQKQRVGDEERRNKDRQKECLRMREQQRATERDGERRDVRIRIC